MSGDGRVEFEMTMFNANLWSKEFRVSGSRIESLKKGTLAIDCVFAH